MTRGILHIILDLIENGIPLIPFHQAFYDEEGRIKTELLLADGAHPDREGYRQMFEQIDISIFD